MWLKPKHSFVLSMTTVLLLTGCMKENAVTKHRASAGEVDGSFRIYDGKATPATEAEISAHAVQFKRAVEKQFHNPNEYSGKVCSLRIEMAPDGLLLGIHEVSGDADLCHTVLEAVKKADIPRPPTPEVYAVVKNASLNFRL